MNMKCVTAKILFLFNPLFCACLASAATDTLSVRLETTDGSVLIGQAMVSNVPVRTSFADIVLRLDQVVSFRFAGTNGVASIRQRNGDSISGETSLREFPLATVFGRVNVPVSLVQTLTVMASRTSLPADLLDVLVLHYSFDADDSDRVSDLSPKVNHGKLQGKRVNVREGVIGGAMYLDGQTRVVLDKPIVFGKEMTLCTWFTIDAGFGLIAGTPGPRTMSFLLAPPPISTSVPRGVLDNSSGNFPRLSHHACGIILP